MDRRLDQQAVVLSRLIGVLMMLWMLSPATRAQSYDELRDSLEEATKLVTKFPDNADLRLKKASWNMLLEQWDYAKREYDIILAKDPTNVAALYFRAYVNEKLNRYKFARKDYEAMLKIVPNHLSGQLGLALLNQKDMHYTEALNIMNRLVEQYPDSAIVYAARAGIEVERKMFDVAEYDYSQAMRLEPSNTDHVISRADVRIRMKKTKEARQDLDTAVRMGIPRAALIQFYRKCE